MLGLRPGLVHEGAAVFPRLIVQVWAETLRDARAVEGARRGLRQGPRALGAAGRALQEAGMMRADVPAESVARTMIAAAQGFVAQMALFGRAPVEVLQDGLRGLMSMGVPAEGDRVDHSPVNVLETPAN